MANIKDVWVLERNVALMLSADEKVLKLASSQYFDTKKAAELARLNEKTQVTASIKACYGIAPNSDDIITIGDIIVNRRNISAVNFKIRRTKVAVDDSACTEPNKIPDAQCVTDDEDDSDDPADK